MWLNAFWAIDRVVFFRQERIREIQMIRLLGMIVVLFVLVAGVGIYRGWFHAGSQDTNGKGTLILTVDKDKLNQDKASATQEVKDLEHK
jgi:hypothetical protein